MKKNITILGLLLVPLLLAEVLTGTIGFVHMMNPVLMINLVLLYGLGNILIREARIRMHLKAGIIFLAIAYGIYEEGFSILSFFNNSHPHLNNLRDYGVIYGFNPIWAISLTVFHTVVSVLLPQKLFELLNKEDANKKYLSTKTMIILLIIFLLNGLFTAFISITSFDLSPMDMLIKMSLCLGVIGLLIYLASISREFFEKQGSSLEVSSYKLALLAFLIQFFNLIIPYRFESWGIPAVFTLIMMILMNLIFLSIGFKYSFFAHCNAKQFKGLFWGSMMIFILTNGLRFIGNLTIENGMPLLLWGIVLVKPHFIRQDGQSK